MKVELERIDEAFHFRAINENGRHCDIDASPDIGGGSKGFRPMELLLVGLAGCSAIDVVSILKKQREPLISLKINVEGERNRDKSPALFESIHIHFMFQGELNREKVERAINLSLETYCSVAKMLEKTAKISHSFSL